MRRTLKQIRAILVEGAAPAAEVLSRRARFGVYLGRLGVRILEQWARDRCPQQAAALAFQTALSLVPILAIAFTVLRGAGFLDAESQLVDFVATSVLPQLPDVAEHLRTFSDNISRGAAGPGGLLFTFVACFSLYASAGKIFNDIWRVKVRRPLLYRVLVFYALVTLLPVLAAAYLYWSGKLMFAGRAAQLLGPLLFQFVALFLTIKLLPNTAVRWGAAFAGAMVAGVLLEALKWGFITFARQLLLDNYAGIYGAAGLVPVVLVWIYASWLVILLGAEVANAIQNLRRLEAEDRRQRRDEPQGGAVAVQLLAAIAADHERGGRGVSREALAEEFGLSPEVVERICDRLRARGLVAEVQGDKQGFIPGRPAAAIPLADVLAVFRSGDLETAAGTTSPTLAGLLRELEESRRTRLGAVTLADVLPRDDVVPLSVRRGDG